MSKDVEMGETPFTTSLTDQDYADIGRALVEHVHGRVAPRVTDDHLSGQRAIEHRGLRVTLRFAPRDGEDLWPPVCCICVLDEGVVICRGPCCDW